MGLPNINITFTTLASTAISRGDKGTICLLLRDTVPEGESGEYVVSGVADIPLTLSADNQGITRRGLTGYRTPPRKILVKLLADEEEIETGLAWASMQNFDYLCGPGELTAEESEKIASWIKTERLAGKKYKAVLPETAADHEGVVNFCAGNIKTADGIFTAAQFCSRIAGIIAGTPWSESATYVPLFEVLDADRMSRADADKAVEDGKFILWFDGEKWKTGRAVNSLVTTGDGHGEAFQKIKIVEVVDLIKEDIRLTAEDNFIGRYANSYDNKCLLVSAVSGYLEGLYRDGILADIPAVGIDLAANRLWLKSHGLSPDSMSDDEVKRASTGSVVNLTATMQILDAIEDINLPIILNQ